jgi:hypothetical protein
MRILIVNTSEKTGGAAVAANRLMEALNNNGEKAKMLVRDKETDCLTVVGMAHPWRQQLRFLWSVGAYSGICASAASVCST